MLISKLYRLTRALPEMNIEAVSLLLEGRQEAAVSQLYKCLELSKSLHESGFLESQASLFGTNNEGCVVSPVSLDEVFMSNSARQQQQLVSTNCFRLFSNAFVLDVDDISSHKHLMALVCAIHYNIAVVYHDLGLEFGDLNWLSGALRFYQVTQDLISEHGLGELLSTLDLALCNNMGHLFAFFSNKEGIVEMRSRMHHRLQLTAPQYAHRDIYNFFRYNLVLADHVEMTVAAAA